jgi:peptidoglycan/LPS O-acetylase OafA/YrhL
VDWSKYEIFSVLSGVVCLALAVAPDLKASERLWALLAGVLTIGYGIYVAGQDSGTYTFPVQIFFIPFLFGGVLIAKIVKARRRDEHHRR